MTATEAGYTVGTCGGCGDVLVVVEGSGRRTTGRDNRWRVVQYLTAEGRCADQTCAPTILSRRARPSDRHDDA
jgi:hypothetical protein